MSFAYVNLSKPTTTKVDLSTSSSFSPLYLTEIIPLLYPCPGSNRTEQYDILPRYPKKLNNLRGPRERGRSECVARSETRESGRVPYRPQKQKLLN